METPEGVNMEMFALLVFNAQCSMGVTESTLPTPCECFALSDSIKVQQNIQTTKQSYPQFP